MNIKMKFKKTIIFSKVINLIATFAIVAILVPAITPMHTVKADAPPFAGGTGTSEDPYQLETCVQLQSMGSEDGIYLDKHFVMNNDIDCSMTNPDSDNFDSEGVWADGKGFDSIGLWTGWTWSNNRFLSGTFDGQGHVVSDLFIDRATDTIGLFALVKEGEILNVGVKNANFTTTSNTAGGLVGHLYLGTVRNSYTSGSVTGNDTVGGLAGISRGYIYNSYSTASVVSTDVNYSYAGGLVGTNDDESGEGGIIEKSYATGNVSGSKEATGGFIGWHWGGTIRNSFSTGDVSGVLHMAGFAGIKDGTLEDVFWYESEANSGLSCWTDWANVGFDTGCSKITSEQGLAYFYDYDNAPMSMSGEGWDFSVAWSDSLNGENYPILIWQEASEEPNSEPEGNPVAEEGAPTNTREIVEAQKAKIISWKANLTENTNEVSCPVKVRLEIKGKHFAKNAQAKIGNKKASSVDRKSSKKIVARFCYEKLTQAKTDSQRAVKVINPSAKEAKAKKKIDIKNITKDFNEVELTMQTFEGIKNIQKALIQLKYLDAQYVTGFYGPLTYGAVKKFQADNGIEQTGTVGPITRAKLAEKTR
jgi:hypothetical protein